MWRPKKIDIDSVEQIEEIQKEINKCVCVKNREFCTNCN